MVNSVQRRRRWTPKQKLKIVQKTNEPGSSVSLVARVKTLTINNGKEFAAHSYIDEQLQSTTYSARPFVSQGAWQQ